MQFVTIIAGTAVLDAVAAQLVRYAIACRTLEVVGGLAEQPNGWWSRAGVLYLRPYNAEALNK